MSQSNDEVCNLYALVQQFYDATQQPRPAVPTRMSTAARARYMQYLLSEIVEFGEATTLLEQVCEVLDMLFFVYDVFVEMGVDPNKPFQLLHAANMRKVFPDGEAHWDYSVTPYRLLRPPDWVSANDAIGEYIKSLTRGDAEV